MTFQKQQPKNLQYPSFTDSFTWGQKHNTRNVGAEIKFRDKQQITFRLITKDMNTRQNYEK